MNGFRFHDPLWLLALIPAALALVHVARAGRKHAVTFSSAMLLEGLPVTFLLRARRLLPVLRAAGVALVVVALARPQQGREESRVRADALAIELVIDHSGSMDALDFELDGKRVNRLVVVKDVVRRFIEGDAELPGRPEDLIGLVAFGGYPESRCPLTFDHGALLKVLGEVEIPGSDATAEERIHGREFLREASGTAIGDALAVGVKRLEDVDAKSRILILLSDGEQTTGVLSPQEGAQLAQAAGIKVYTVGIGSTGFVPVRSTDPFGRAVLSRMEVRLDEATLRDIAAETGGAYANARTTEQLRDVYRKIDESERTEIERTIFTEYSERYAWALFPGVALLLLDLLLRATRFRSLP